MSRTQDLLAELAAEHDAFVTALGRSTSSW